MPGYRRSGSPPGGGAAGGRTGAGPTGTGARPPRSVVPTPRPRPAPRPVEDDEADYQLPGAYDEDAAPETPLRRSGGAPRRSGRQLEEEGAPRARVGGRRRASRREIEEAEGPVRLADLCAEFFSLILELRATGEMPEPVALERKITALFEEMRERAAEARIPPSDVEHARYALAAFIDETILNSPSPMKDAWVAMPLQMRYFNENTAGEGFFERLEQIRKMRGARDALEVYYLCLTLGFEGRYRLSPGGELTVLIDELRSELAPRGRRGADIALAPNGARPDAADGPQRKQLPLYAIAGGFVLLVVIILIVVGHSVSSSARAQADRLRAEGAAEGTR